MKDYGLFFSSKALGLGFSAPFRQSPQKAHHL